MSSPNLLVFSFGSTSTQSSCLKLGKNRYKELVLLNPVLPIYFILQNLFTYKCNNERDCSFLKIHIRWERISKLCAILFSISIFRLTFYTCCGWSCCVFRNRSFLCPTAVELYLFWSKTKLIFWVIFAYLVYFFRNRSKLYMKFGLLCLATSPDRAF